MLFLINNAITEVNQQHLILKFSYHLTQTTCADMYISLIGVKVFGIINGFLILGKKASNISLKVLPCTKKQFYLPFSRVKDLI